MNNKLKVTSKVTKLGVWNDIPSDSINSFILEFEFDEEWADLVCVAQFGQGNNTYNQLIVDNKCALPTELNVGELRISVFGSKTDGTAYRSTTIPLVTEIIQSGFDGHGEDTIPPSPDLYEQLLEEFSNGGVHSLNTLKGDISLVDGDSTTVTTDTENGEISVNVAVDYKLSGTSENPVQNKVVKSALDGKLDKTGGTVSGQLSADVLAADTYVTAGMSVETPKVFGLNAPVNDNEAANKGYVDTQEALNEKLANKVTAFTGDETDTQYPSAKLIYNSITSLAKQTSSALDGKLDLTGGTMQGLLNMNGNSITNVGQLAFFNNKILNMSNGRIINLAAPTIPTGAANKKYVDDAIAAALIVDTEEVIP